MIRAPASPSTACHTACARQDGSNADTELKRRHALALRQSGRQQQISPGRNARLTAAGSDGMPSDVRAAMEHRLGASFASVRVHAAGERAVATALAGARAITRGEEISFAPGHFDPHTPSGRALLAHELTHVMQQRRGASGGSLSSQARLEQEAQAAEHPVLASSAGAATLGRAPREEQHAGFGEMLAVIRAAGSGGLVGAANHIVANYAKDDPLIQRIDRLRAQAMARVGEIVLPASMVQRLQGLYTEIKGMAPSWLPLPEIQFVATAQPAAPLLIIAGVAITVEALILLCAMLIVFLWLLGNLDPATRRGRERAVEDVIEGLEELLKPKPGPITKPPEQVKPEKKPDLKPDPKPDPKPKPDPITDPPPIPPQVFCPFPTGLTPTDPIAMTWFKPRDDDYYPARLKLANGMVFGRDDPSNPRELPLGEPLGVPNRFWPRKDKTMSLVPVERGTAAADFRAVLTGYGFDWNGNGTLQADHVQDVEWGGPDSFENLWPMSSDANGSAGPRQNQHQRVDYCETRNGPPFIAQPLSVFKTLPGRYGRFFRIAAVSR